MFRILKFISFLLIMFIASKSMAQGSIPKIEGDLKYREDQFYIGVTYNIIADVPSGVSSDGLTGGINFGFLRDMPINKKRNLAIAVGTGMAFDQYGQNILIDKDSEGNTVYTVLDSGIDFDSNTIKTGIIELPIELRWRSSTPTINKFWRVYAGFRFGYTFWNRYSYKDSTQSISHNSVKEYDKLRLNATMSLGFNKFNFFINYSLNPFFNEDALTTDGEQVNFKTLKLGLIFYIL